MEKSKFSEKGVSGTSRAHGFSEQTLDVWRKKFRGLQVDDVKRLKALEAENSRLKKLVAEQVLAPFVMKEINANMVSAQGRRQQVACAHHRGLSRVTVCSDSSFCSQRCLTGANSTKVMRQSLRARRPSFVHLIAMAAPQIRILLGREGLGMSSRRAY